MEQHVLEGTWEEMARHAEEFAGRRVRVTVLDEAIMPNPRNEAMLAVLERSQERLKDLPIGGSTEETLKMIREARGGKMWGYEPTE